MVVLRHGAMVANFMIAALLVAGPAVAHVSLQPAQAVAGGYQVLRFGVGHGCDGKATTGLRLEIPESVTIARPQPKPGWALSIALRAGTDAPAAIAWTGALPADEFDEFLVLAKLPGTEGRLAISVLQTCGPVEIRWGDPPSAEAKRPAPTILLTPTPPSAAPVHVHQP